MPLHAVVQPDTRGPGSSVVARELHHLLDRDAADLRDPRRGVFLEHALLQRLEANRVLRDVVAIDQVLGDQDVHHAERQRAVGAGQQRDVLAALLRRQAAVGIDRDQLGAAALGLLRARPEVQVGDDRVGAPDQDQLRLVEALRVHAVAAAERRLDAGLAGRRAQRALELRGAQPVEEAPVHRAVLQHAHGAGVAARQDGLRILGGGRLQARRDLVERLVPADAAEPAFAFLANSLLRIQEPVGRIGALEVVRDLGAQRALGERHRRVALDLDGDAVLHRHQHGAGVGAVVRAGGAHYLGGHGADVYDVTLRSSASSTSSIQCRTGTALAACR